MSSTAAPAVRLEAAAGLAAAAVAASRPAIDRLAERHTTRVLDALRGAGLSSADLAPSDGYGYDAPGRAKLEAVWAALTGAEAALVRPHIASGTAAVAHMLFAATRPDAELVIATGEPYDTVQRVIAGAPGSLAAWGVACRVLPFARGTDPVALAASLSARTACVLVQRSRGYSRRPPLALSRIGALARAVHALRPDVAVVVDNCYGEFVEAAEPPACGADLCAGSWTKNPGGGLASVGGYVAGRADLVERAAASLNGPGQGREVGAVPQGHRLAFQGLFLAPGVVAEALCGGVYASALFSALGFRTDPAPDAPGPRLDIVTRVEIGDPDALLTAVQAIQAHSPVDSRARPEGAAMPGYDDPVVMAAGTFVQGSGMELTADAPMRPPWDLFIQGGLRLGATRVALDAAAERVLATLDARRGGHRDA